MESLRSKDMMASILTTAQSKDHTVTAELMATESYLTTDSLPFSTPESLLESRCRQQLEKGTVSEGIVAVVVVEARCISSGKSKSFIYTNCT